MKKKHNEGTSLIDVLVGIALLALVVIPTCTGLVLSVRINARAEQLLQDQLAVSSAVETLMAKPTDEVDVETLYGVSVEENVDGTVTVSKNDVAVTTYLPGGGA